MMPRDKPQRSMQVLKKQDAGASLPMDLGLLEGKPSKTPSPRSSAVTEICF